MQIHPHYHAMIDRLYHHDQQICHDKRQQFKTFFFRKSPHRTTCTCDTNSQQSYSYFDFQIISGIWQWHGCKETVCCETRVIQLYNLVVEINTTTVTHILFLTPLQHRSPASFSFSPRFKLVPAPATDIKTSLMKSSWRGILWPGIQFISNFIVPSCVVTIEPFLFHKVTAARWVIHLQAFIQ